jgi:hypothetical protein
MISGRPKDECVMLHFVQASDALIHLDVMVVGHNLFLQLILCNVDDVGFLCSRKAADNLRTMTPAQVLPKVNRSIK